MDVRVDPTYSCEGASQTEGKKLTPMEVAVEWDPSFDEGRGELLALLAEFTEMPDQIKLYYLSKLMHKEQNKAKEREEFKKILSSLSVELVNTTNVRGKGNLLQDAVDIEYTAEEGKKNFARILLEFG